jgi:hypothetical protein
MSELLLGALLLLAIAWLVVRVRQNKVAEKAASTPVPKHLGEYRAVAIQYSENACDAAKAMTGRRFLATAAPRLPLPECNYPDCRCQFAHYDDRRADGDRRSPFAPAGTTDGTGSYEKERRERTDRRNDKGADLHDW